MSVAVILLNMGGPESVDDVDLYLKNLFYDPDIFNLKIPSKIKKYFIDWIIKKRTPRTREIYRQIGGASPLNKITRIQAELLQQSISTGNGSDFVIYYALRYCQPYFETVWKNIIEKKYEQIILFPLYPQFSISTTGSFLSIYKKIASNNINTKIIRSYYDHPEYINASYERIKTGLGSLYNIKESLELVISAHGIPVSYIKKGDSYAQEINATIMAIKDKLLPNIKISLGYQSKVGPLRWLKPDTVEVLRRIAGRDVKKIYIYPISFVADNSETLYEIDILYRKIAEKFGIDEYHFIHPFNDYSGFIEAIKIIILELMEGKLDKKYIYDGGHIR